MENTPPEASCISRAEGCKLLYEVNHLFANSGDGAVSFALETDQVGRSKDDADLFFFCKKRINDVDVSIFSQKRNR